ncbi:AAA family ATPase [Nonomuraea muscovyensis]
MYVTRLEIAGVCGFHGAHVCDLDFARPDGSHAGWTVIAGRNGSGKTTLLRVIALALAGPRRGSQLDGELEDHLSHGYTHGSVKATLIADPEVDQGAPLLPEQAAIVWKVPGEGEAAGRAPKFHASPQIHTLLWSSSPPSGWFHAGYGPFRRLTGTGLYQRRPHSADRIAAVRTLFEEQSALTESIDWLIYLHLRDLEGDEGARELLASVLALLNHGLLPYGSRIERVNSEGLWLRRADDTAAAIPLRRMSDGLRTVTGLVLDIIRHMHAAYGALPLRHEERGAPYLPHPGVVLIDEVDAHLHVSWQKRIGGWFKEHFPNVQFIVSTHSPYICQAADPGGLILLPGPDDPQPPRVADEKLHNRVVYGTGDDAVVSEIFGLDSASSDQADALREELAGLEYIVMTGRADEAVTRRYHELRRRLATSQLTRVEEQQRLIRRLEVDDP